MPSRGNPFWASHFTLPGGERNDVLNEEVVQPILPQFFPLERPPQRPLSFVRMTGIPSGIPVARRLETPSCGSHSPGGLGWIPTALAPGRRAVEIH
jgi:hypothetical protein